MNTIKSATVTSSPPLVKIFPTSLTSPRFLSSLSLSPCPSIPQLQHIGLLISSFLNALLSAACGVGLLLAISLTIANEGRGLMLGCNFTDLPINARSPVNADCPFDTTRIYVSLYPSLSVSMLL